MTEQTPTPPQPNPPLRVALDLRHWGRSGIGSYLSALLNGFAEINAPIVWTFVGPEVPVPKRCEVSQWIPFDAPPYSFREFAKYPNLADVDLLHFPHYNLPRTHVKRRVVTVYDLFHLRYGSPLKRLYQRLFLTRLAWGDPWITTISEKVEEELRATSAIAPERIKTIHLGPGRPAPPYSIPQDSITLSDGRRIEPPWLLALGIDQAHKNFDFLLAAASMWYLRRGEAPPLIWMGVSPDKVKERMKSIPAYARQNIHIEPYGDAEKAEALYAGATGLIFPSLDEGFGFPPLEAMARGVPVLCSKRRPMTDLLGDAPIWFDPDDSATLWRALDSLIDETKERDALIERGRAQAARYNWAKTAEATYMLYCEALDRPEMIGRTRKID